jgi:hypothetical protein
MELYCTAGGGRVPYRLRSSGTQIERTTAIAAAEHAADQMSATESHQPQNDPQEHDEHRGEIAETDQRESREDTDDENVDKATQDAPHDAFSVSQEDTQATRSSKRTTGFFGVRKCCSSCPAPMAARI